MANELKLGESPSSNKNTLPRWLDRRESIKVSMAAGMSLITAGILAQNRGFGEILDSMSAMEIEQSERKYLLQSITIPEKWPETVKRSDLINHRYTPPLEMIDRALNNSQIVPYFDSAFPLIASSGELYELTEVYYSQFGRGFDTLLDQSESFKKIHDLQQILYDDTYFGFGDVADDIAFFEKYDAYPSFSRTLNRLPDVTRTQLRKAAHIFNNNYGSNSVMPDNADDLFLQFCMAYQNENDATLSEIDQFRRAKYRGDGSGTLSTSDYVTFFLEKDKGDTLRALVDSIKFARYQTRVVYEPNLGIVIPTERVLTTKAANFMSQLHDDLSLILPWDYLYKMIDSSDVIQNQLHYIYNKSIQTPTDTLDAINLKDWQLINRIGTLSHQLSIIFMCGCIPPSFVPPMILNSYYDVPTLNQNIEEHNVIEGLDTFLIKSMINSVAESRLSQHGRIKFVTDAHCSLDASRIHKRLRRND